MNTLRKIGAKIRSRRSGNTSSSQNRTLRHSCSMPFRNSMETGYYYFPSIPPSNNEDVLDIRAPFPTIAQKERHATDHHPDCDCPHCESLLDEFPAPPPLRPRQRPRDMSQDFDDVLMLPDHVYEARKRQRELDRREAEERQKIYDTVVAYDQRAAKNKSFRDPVDVTPEELDILRRYHPLFRLGIGNQSNHSLGSVKVIYAPNYSPPSTKRSPQIVRKPSCATIATSRPQQSMVNDNASKVRSFNDSGIDRSLRPQGRRNLQGEPIVAAATSTRSESATVSVRSTRPSHAQPTYPPISYKETASLRSRRAHNMSNASLMPPSATESVRSRNDGPRGYTQSTTQAPSTAQHSAPRGHGTRDESLGRRRAASKAKDLPLPPSVSANPYSVMF